jgi:alcohol dehydrogenase
MLPAVVRFNSADPGALHAYAELAAAVRLSGPKDSPAHAVEILIAQLEALLNAAQIARSLADLNVPPSAVGTLAEQAAKQWTANFNPRRTTPGDFRTLYEAAFARRA